MARFLVIFTGHYLEGEAPFEVEQRLSEALNLSLDQRERIFSGKAIVLKRTEDKAEALKLGQQLKALGADIRVKVEDSTDATPSPAPTQETLPPKDEPGGLSVAAQEGFIVSPREEPQNPVTDISHLTLSEEDPGPLPSQSIQAVVQVDTTNLTVKDNDGSPLIDASPEIEASVIAPDFGLGEPGAMLESIGTLDPIAPPDVSAFSLRDGEGNLVDESEFEQRDEVVVSTDHLKVSEQGPT